MPTLKIYTLGNRFNRNTKQKLRESMSLPKLIDDQKKI